MTRRAREKRIQRLPAFPLRLTPDEKRTLRERARTHGVSMAAYARAAICGVRPGGAPGETARAADEWWDTLSPQRRAQIHGWVAGKSARHDPGPGQLTIFEAKEGAE